MQHNKDICKFDILSAKGLRVICEPVRRLIHRFSESLVRDRIQLKLKDEEAEVEVTGSRLEEEANMSEIKED